MRTEILIKKEKVIELYEVKAKSIGSADKTMVLKSTRLPNAEWRSYLCDIAFQKHVVRLALPTFTINTFLTVADKSVTATVNGLNQKFLLDKDD